MYALRPQKRGGLLGTGTGGVGGGGGGGAGKWTELRSCVKVEVAVLGFSS